MRKQKIKLTDKQFSRLFHGNSNTTIRIRRNYKWLYISRSGDGYHITDWTGKEQDCEVIEE